VTRSVRPAGLLILAMLVGAGCDSNPGAVTAPTSTAISSAGTSLTPDVRAALERGLQDEYRAETIYQGVIDDFGIVAPFVNVIGAEQRHSAAIALMFTRRDLAVPASQWTVATVPHFTSVSAACAAGAVAERENIAMYDALLLLPLPSDVRQVFESNRTASLVAHLPAFERCS
jgi:hypothetical protein